MQFTTPTEFRIFVFQVSGKLDDFLNSPGLLIDRKGFFFWTCRSAEIYLFVVNLTISFALIHLLITPDYSLSQRKYNYSLHNIVVGSVCVDS